MIVIYYRVLVVHGLLILPSFKNPKRTKYNAHSVSNAEINGSIFAYKCENLRRATLCVPSDGSATSTVAYKPKLETLLKRYLLIKLSIVFKRSNAHIPSYGDVLIR